MVPDTETTGTGEITFASMEAAFTLAKYKKHLKAAGLDLRYTCQTEDDYLGTVFRKEFPGLTGCALYVPDYKRTGMWFFPDNPDLDKWVTENARVRKIRSVGSEREMINLRATGNIHGDTPVQAEIRHLENELRYGGLESEYETKQKARLAELRRAEEPEEPAEFGTFEDFGVFEDVTEEPELSAPETLATDTGECLADFGKWVSLFGSFGTGKSWIAAYWAAEFIRDEKHVVWLDFERQPEIVRGRLTAMGIDAAAIRTYFHYVNAKITSLARVADAVWRFTGSDYLVVTDSYTELHASLEAGDMNRADSVTSVYSALFESFPGATGCIIDHANRAGSFAASERKMSGVDAAYQVTMDKSGYKLTVAKALRSNLGKPVGTAVAKSVLEGDRLTLVATERPSEQGPEEPAATGPGTLLCADCGGPKKKKPTERCQPCSNRFTLQSRGQI